MRGSYYRQRLQTDIKSLQIERRDLEAERHRLQSAGLILDRAAKELGMQPAAHREFVELPAASPTTRQ
jgi:hypothetical protein